MRILATLWLAWAVAVAGHIGWGGDFDRALEASRKSGKPMLVVLVKRGCAPCGRLVAAMAADEALSRLIGEKMVPVLVTKENEDYPIELLYTQVYPTIFLLNPEEIFLMAPIEGERTTAKLYQRLRTSL